MPNSRDVNTPYYKKSKSDLKKSCSIFNAVWSGELKKNFVEFLSCKKSNNRGKKRSYFRFFQDITHLYGPITNRGESLIAVRNFDMSSIYRPYNIFWSDTCVKVKMSKLVWNIFVGNGDLFFVTCVISENAFKLIKIWLERWYFSKKWCMDDS